MSARIIALSGAIGSGKAALAEALSKDIGAPVASFGKEVRRYTEARGLDFNDRFVLQQIGQALVLNDLEGFVGRVVGEHQQAGNDKLIIVAGVRHVEVLLELRRTCQHVVLIQIEMSGYKREKRLMRDGTERRIVGQYDNDITEEQVSRILPQYANGTINGEWPLELQVARTKQILNGFIFPHGKEASAKAAGIEVREIPANEMGEVS